MNQRKVLLKDIAYERIKEKIIKKEVEHMSENVLVEELSMSRTPIREALQRLQHEGFVRIISNQGIVVTEISVNRLHDLIDMRVAIETFSLQQAIKIVTENDFTNIKDIICSQKEAISKNDIYSFRRRDADFHNYLLDITGNYYFLKMFTEVHELQFTASKRAAETKEMERLVHEHEEVIQFLYEDNIELATESLRKHLIGGKKSLLF